MAWKEVNGTVWSNAEKLGVIDYNGSHIAVFYSNSSNLYVLKLHTGTICKSRSIQYT